MSGKTLISICVFTIMVTPIWHANVADAQLVERGLVSYWAFDKDTIEGGILKDVWGNNDGKIYGDPKVINGKVKESLEFDGVDDYVEVPDNDSLDMGKSDFSICAWIKTEAKEVFDFMAVIFGDGDMMGGGDPSYSILLFSKTMPAFELYDLKTYLDRDGHNSQKPVNDGKYYHLAWVFDHDKDCSIYINGKFDIKYDISMIGDLNNNQDSMIGNQPTRDFFFPGVIDELVIYNRTLSEAEVAKNFDAKGLSVEPMVRVTLTWGEIKKSTF
ncbi:LamG domain-containing protein [Candidatus Poribacteria bacterium]|nr:LamG domain-containing protein [Candidatus Poribacteria bacterium]